MYRFSYLDHLQCARCGMRQVAAGQVQTCTCGSPLLARYDLQGAAQSLTKQRLTSRPPTLWRYHELLPVTDPSAIVSLHEAMTPILPLSATGAEMDIDHLLLKDESALPSGTFKARGAAVGVSKALELGVRNLAIPSNGNAGAAWSLYAARAGIHATVVTPQNAPLTPRKECVIAGATLYVIDGTIGDAGTLVQRACVKHNWYNVATLKEPYRLEGKKTMGLEIAEQFGWSVPDVIIYPTGGGAGVIGIDKGLRELQEMGFIGAKFPRMVIVQAAGCAPLVRAFRQGDAESQSWQDPHTIAFGMRVPKALGDSQILEIVRRSGGTAVCVTDEQIELERAATVRQEGLHVCPEGAAALAGARQLRASGWIREGERVLVMNTGSGLKYVDQITGSGVPIDLSAEL